MRLFILFITLLGCGDLPPETLMSAQRCSDENCEYLQHLPKEGRTADSIHLSFSDYCREADHESEFSRDISIVLNALDAWNCEEALITLQKKPELVLDGTYNLKLSNLVIISSLGMLNHLAITNHEIVDGSPISQLKSLQYLDLSDNKISDFSFLKYMGPQLESLYTSGNIRIPDKNEIKEHLPNLKIYNDESTE